MASQTQSNDLPEPALLQAREPAVGAPVFEENVRPPEKEIQEQKEKELIEDAMDLEKSEHDLDEGEGEEEPEQSQMKQDLEESQHLIERINSKKFTKEDQAKMLDKRHVSKLECNLKNLITILQFAFQRL